MHAAAGPASAETETARPRRDQRHAPTFLVHAVLKKDLISQCRQGALAWDRGEEIEYEHALAARSVGSIRGIVEEMISHKATSVHRDWGMLRHVRTGHRMRERRLPP